MSKFNEHSPLPWITESSWGFGGIQDAEGDIVFALAAPREGEKNHGKIAQCNDDFILEACNSYYQNKEAINELTETLREALGFIENFNHIDFQRWRETLEKHG